MTILEMVTAESVDFPSSQVLEFTIPINEDL